MSCFLTNTDPTDSHGPAPEHQNQQGEQEYMWSPGAGPLLQRWLLACCTATPGPLRCEQHLCSSSCNGPMLNTCWINILKDLLRVSMRWLPHLGKTGESGTDVVMESSLADFVGGGFHPFVEPWFILFLVLFLDSLPASSGIDSSSAFSESLSVQSNSFSSQLSCRQWLSPGSHFPFVELCDNFFSCIAMRPEEVCMHCAKKEFQTTERKSKKDVCLLRIRRSVFYVSKQYAQNLWHLSAQDWCDPKDVQLLLNLQKVLAERSYE